MPRDDQFVAEEHANHPPVRRLRVWHFLLATTLCAVVLVVRDKWFKWELISGDSEIYVRTALTYSSLLYGLAFLGLCLFLWQAFRTGSAGISAPGHLLLLFSAISAFLELAVGLIVRWYEANSISLNPEYYAWNLEKILTCTSVALNCFLFAYLMIGRWYWKVILIFPGCVLALLVPQHIYLFAMNGLWKTIFATSHPYAQMLGCSVIGWFLSFAIWKDWEQRNSWDWLHWAGVGITSLFAVCGFVSSLAWLHYYA